MPIFRDFLAEIINKHSLILLSEIIRYALVIFKKKG